MKVAKKVISALLSVTVLLSCCVFSSAQGTSDITLTSEGGASVRVDTVGYDSTGEAVISADMRFRSKLEVPDSAELVEFGFVYTLSQYLNDNVKLKYNQLEDALKGTQGFELIKDQDYGYSAVSKSITLTVYSSENPSLNKNFVKRYNSNLGISTYTFNLVMSVKKAYFTSHAFVSRAYYVYRDETGELVTVYGNMYSRCLKYVAYKAYFAKDSSGKYVENNNTRVTLAEILGYRDPGSSGFY